MGEPKLKLMTSATNKTSKSALEAFKKTLTEELIIGICSPIGSLKEKVLEEIKDILLKEYKYKEVKTIKLSKFIDLREEEDIYENELPNIPENSSKIFNDYFHKINKGNAIRRNSNNARLAELAIEEIHLDRIKQAKNEIGKDKHPEATDYKSRRICYIIDSIKTKEELSLLKNVYSENFFSISIFSSLEDRRYNLNDDGFSNKEIEEIIEIDDRQTEDFGQNVRDVFIEGDYFLRVSLDSIPKVESKIKRFFHLVFETKIITPTIEEMAMYNAKAAAGNSSCLSRQVGACIVDENNNIISVGWNDVPKFGGNLYTANSSVDNRCFNLGYCSNDKHKRIVVNDVIDSILEIPEFKKILEDNSFNREILEKKIAKNSKVKDLIEFSRSVHAEMHAIIQGALTTGDKLLNSRLFCTTYPCHNCARHIIAAGIKEVYYIEPYVKSLCLSLHNDAMSESEESTNKVKILIFDGVSPNRYLSFFTNFAERKEDGLIIKKDLEVAKPKTSKTLQALSTLEEQAIISLNK